MYGSGKYGQFVYHGVVSGVVPPVPIEVEPPIQESVNVYNDNGNLIWSFNLAHGNSPLVEFQFKEKFIGGLESFKFSLSKDYQIPFFSKMNARLYHNRILYAQGEITFLPDQSQQDKLTFEGSGYVKQYKNVTIEETYDTTTLSAILHDIASTGASLTQVLYSASTISVPVFNISHIEFQNKSIYDAMNTLLSIANSIDSDYQYMWYIDKNRVFNFRNMSNDILNNFFEGYHFQEPKVEEKSGDNIINTIDIFRGDATEENEIVKVGTVSDADSQGKYGIQKKKLTIPDYVDDTTAENVAQGIINLNKDAIIYGGLKNINCLERLAFGKYRYNIRPDEYWKAVSECDSLTGWTSSLTGGTTFQLDTNEFFTGRKAFKLVTAVGSSGDYIEYEFDDFYNPENISLYLKSSLAGEIGTLRVFASDDSYVDKTITIKVPGIWSQHLYNIEGVEDAYKIRLIISRDYVSTFYLDRIDVQFNSWLTYEGVLKEVTYKLNGLNLIAEISVGDDKDNFLSEVEDIDEKNSIALDIFERVT